MDQKKNTRNSPWSDIICTSLCSPHTGMSHIKTVQHVTVLNTVGNCNTVVL